MSDLEIVSHQKEPARPSARHLPPWKKSTFSQKLLRLALIASIYLPVATLWFLCITFYVVYITYYLLPNIKYESSHASIYYWNDPEEYKRAKAKAWSLFALITIFYLLFIYSAYKATTLSPGNVPDDWDITGAKKSDIEKRQDGNERICIRCEMKKPDRTHHCRQCESCILRMDHHCNWIANCVGFWNYKHFMCMLFYGDLSLCLFVSTFWETVVVILNNETNDLFECFFVTFVYSVACMVFIVLSVFMGFHFWMIWNNFTTIEYCEKKKKNVEGFTKKSPYHLGTLNNFKQALGKNPWTWLIPVKFETDSDGIHFINCNT